MSTLVWLFFGMSVIISVYVTAKVTSWNVKRKYNKKANTKTKSN